MSREVKRVALDFDWPLKQVWRGYLLPEALQAVACPQCRSGYGPVGERLYERWYGNAPFDPAETGSPRLTADTPAVREFAESNVARAPAYYGVSEAAIRREAQRLAALFNGAWQHHLAQADVDALVAAGRLLDFTHRWTGHGWEKLDPPVTPTAAEVNAWSLRGLGHDSLNAHIVIAAACARAGAPLVCARCDGHGSIEAYPGQRAAAAAWQPEEPPPGAGWQLWETVSEGSPVSPVFPTEAEFIRYLIELGHSRRAAERFVAAGYAPSAVGRNGNLAMNIAAYDLWEEPDAPHA